MSDSFHTTARSVAEECLAVQRERYGSGEPVLVEELLEKHPSLQQSKEDLLDLIYQEMLLRKQNGEYSTLQEYLDRFPTLVEELRIQFALEAVFLESTCNTTGAAVSSEVGSTRLQPTGNPHL